MTSIVLGVDGSDASQRALLFAIEEARLRGASLRVICAWQLEMEAWAGEVPAPKETLDRPRRDAEKIVAEVKETVGRLAPDVGCDCLALEGNGGSLLLEHSSDAALIVLGRRGHGVADRLLGSVADVVLGSVSHHVIREAQCPVVVVPPATSPS